MIIGNNDTSVDSLFNKYLKDIRFKYNKPIGEIVISTYEFPETEIFKKCDSDNILSKTDYPELYEVIGDMYQNMSTRQLQSHEFVIPNMEGRYLCMRSEGGNFELTPDSLQSFALETVEFYAYLPSNTVTRSYFRSILNRNTTNKDVDRFEKPVKRIICDITDHIRKSVSGDDKTVLYYMRVK